MVACKLAPPFRHGGRALHLCLAQRKQVGQLAQMMLVLGLKPQAQLVQLRLCRQDQATALVL
eukprot:3897797-Prymnesium_polylepis.2